MNDEWGAVVDGRQSNKVGVLIMAVVSVGLLALMGYLIATAVSASFEPPAAPVVTPAVESGPVPPAVTVEYITEAVNGELFRVPCPGGGVWALAIAGTDIEPFCAIPARRQPAEAEQ